MAVTYIGKGTDVTGTTSLSPGYPAGITANDRLLLFVWCWNNSGATPTPSTPAGWTLESTYNTGTTGGSYRYTVHVFSKAATGSETGTLAVSVSGALNCSATIVETRGSGAIEILCANGSQSSGSITFASSPASAAGDLVFVAVCTPSGSGSSETLSQSGVTFAAAVEVSDFGSANHKGILTYHAATAGTSSGNATWTNAGSSYGFGTLVRIREIPPSPITGSFVASISCSGGVVGQGVISGATIASLSCSGGLDGKGFASGSMAISLMAGADLTGLLPGGGSTYLSVSCSADLSGRGYATGVISMSLVGTATVTGASQLAGATSLSLSPAAGITGRSSSTGASSIALTLAGTGTLIVPVAGAFTMTLACAGACTGRATVAATSSLVLSIGGTAAGRALLVGATAIALSANGDVTGRAGVNGTTGVTLALASDVLGRGLLTGSTSIEFVATLDNRVLSELTGAVAISFGASGNVAGRAHVIGTAPINVVFSASIREFPQPVYITVVPARLATLTVETKAR